MAFDISSISGALGDAMFNGDASIAGICIFAAVIIIIFCAFAKKNIMVPFFAMLPVTVIFSLLGIIPSSLAVILTLITVLVLAGKAREAL